MRKTQPLFCNTGILFCFGISFFSPALLLAQSSPMPSEQKKEKIQLYGIIKNGTGTGFKKIPDLELVRLGKGMQIVEKISPSSLLFRFSLMEEDRVPYLIRAFYQGASYSLFLPPQKQLWKKKQVLVVYDKGAKIKDIQITSVMQVTKLKGKLLVEKIFAAQNKSSPPKSFSLKELGFFIPENAKNIQASLRYHSTGIPIPLQPILHQEDCRFTKSLRPGDSELNIRYMVPGEHLTDQTWFSRKNPKQKYIRTLIWRPKVSKPNIKDAEHKLIHIPNAGSALQINYKLEEKVFFDFTHGAYLVQEPLKSDENPVYDHPGKTIFALFVILFHCLGITALTAKKMSW